MDTPVCKLTLTAPQDIAAVLADTLDALPEQVRGYTIIEADGRGPNIELLSPIERVRGAMKVAQFVIVLPREAVSEVLDRVAERCQRRQMAFWVEPVLDFGRLE